MSRAARHRRNVATARAVNVADVANVARVRGVDGTHVARLVSMLLVVGLAPVAGDVGSCGQTAEDLDAFKFFAVKEQIDCERCGECDIQTRACDAACDFSPADEFPRGCYPLIHDGEVCLHALEAAGCPEYRDYMADEGATTPTECNFCPPEEAP